MRITRIDAVHPSAPSAPADWRSWLGQILVRVQTDSGAEGFGVGGGGESGVHIVKTVLNSLLVGCDAEAVEENWKKMHRGTLAFGRKGVAMMAISGVDLALWDLRGRNAGKPVAECLGGAVGNPIPTYRTLFPGEAPGDTQLKDFHALKLHAGKQALPNPDAISQRVMEAREIVGPERVLMLDAFMGWTVESTLDIARRVEHCNLEWLEEPLPPDDLDGYEHLGRESPVPVAGGEHEYTASAFEGLMKRSCHQVYQPDVCWCGGLTQLIRIYELAEQYGYRVCPHRGSEVWALHAIAALDPTPLAESGRPWMHWVEGQPTITKGTITLTNSPGFGVTFDPSLWL